MRLLKKSVFRVIRPEHIAFGDPLYFEQYRGEKLRKLVLDMKPSKRMEACVVLREDIMEREDFDDQRIFAALSEEERTRRMLMIYLAPSRTMPTYLEDMQYNSQEVSYKRIGVDSATYMLSVDDRSERIYTSEDGFWGSVTTLYRVVNSMNKRGSRTLTEAVIITAEMPSDYDFDEMKQIAKYLFKDLEPVTKN